MGDLGSIPGLGRSPGRGHSNPLQYSCLGNPHGQRSLAGYSPWGRKESDMTERLSTVQKCINTYKIYHKDESHKTVLETYYKIPKTEEFSDGFFSLLDTTKTKVSESEDRSIEINQIEL